MKAKILVVDDDDDIRFFFSNVLSKNNYFVITAPNGAKAISHVNEEKFDFAILDFMLPDIKGNELAVELKKIDGELKYVFVTGFAQGLLELGISADIIVEKPVFHEDLLALVEINLI